LSRCGTSVRAAGPSQGGRGRELSGSGARSEGTSGDGRSTLIVTRQRIKKPQSDEEFRAEFEQLTPEEQDRRIELIENLDAVEFERRFRILGRQTPEIEKLLKRCELPLYDRIALTESELFYEETSDPAQGCPVEVELLNPPPLSSL